MLLILLLLLEAVLMVYRIKTKSMQRKLTAALRTASVLILAALCTLSVVTWGFRYYALAAVLVISALMNTAQFLRKREIGVTLKPVRLYS
jgi:phosphatidylserine synthase